VTGHCCNNRKSVADPGAAFDTIARVKIAFVAPFAYSPKATVSARMLPMATALTRAGHTLDILIPPYDNPGDSNRAWEHEGVRLENMSVGGKPEAARTLLDLAQQLARRVQTLAPDVVHLFKPIGISALCQWHLSGAYAKRIVVDNDDWEGPGGWVDVNPYSLPQKAFATWQERWSLQHASAVTCASDVLVDRTRGFRGTHNDDANSVLRFPNGPDNRLRALVDAALPRRADLRERFGWRGPIAIYTGTIPHGNDMDMAVRAVADTPGLRWVIVASGGGIPALKQSIEAAGIAARVEWHAFMPYDALIERLVAADIALYPYRDTNINRAKCSGKIMDYMAAARPIVTSDVGMNRAYLEHGHSALLTRPGDATAFSAALRELLTNPAQAAALGAAAQARIWDLFGWDARIGELIDVYARVSWA
jgi:glycosyltransferase involved in cell wall biosynthesis